MISISKAVAALSIFFLMPSAVSAQDVPITASAEARDLYLRGRDLAEKLRATDARAYYERAVAEDPDFALGYWALAITAPTNRDFFDALESAVTLADGASEGERHIILALDAAARGNPVTQQEHLSALESAYPSDERVHNLLGNFHFGRQEYDLAIASYEQALAIDSEFSQPYNQLGYAYRFQKRYEDAERAFKRYAELIPDEPNPYDSYAELLMKLGRFEESIENYRKALDQDPNFVASYVGIANNQIFLGRGDEARATLRQLEESARTDGERRTAMLWKAASYVHEGKTEEALEAVAAMSAVAETRNDLGALSGDQALMGTILLESGDPDAAIQHYDEALKLIRVAEVPDDVKAATERNNLFNEGRVALTRGDLATAEVKAREYSEAAREHGIPFEIWNSHELQGMVALHRKDFESAVKHLKQANQQNPRVLYYQAVALHGAGDSAGAKAAMEAAAKFNGLNFNYAYVRDRAIRKAQKAMKG